MKLVKESDVMGYPECPNCKYVWLIQKDYVVANSLLRYMKSKEGGVIGRRYVCWNCNYVYFDIDDKLMRGIINLRV